MNRSVISVERLGKRYSLRHEPEGQQYLALRDVLAVRARLAIGRIGGFAGLFGRSAEGWVRRASTSAEEFWALRGVSFEVKKGEVLGVIGRNGAGKTTLLKVLSRITEPTEGSVRMRGRVASLLEVGTGFHPELTGRENIFLNGTILGMSRTEVRDRFDEIVDFAEVARFLDTPVKRYSSGMYVRLAFAVAAHLRPEVLLVDEVLAVGDSQFQKKCLGKMQEVSEIGRTVLFVSHNMGVIRSLCPRAILLADGRLILDGDAHTVCQAYLSETVTERKSRRVQFPANQLSSSRLSFLEAAVLGPSGSDNERLQIDSQISICIRYRVEVPLKGVVIGVRVRRDGVLLFNSFDTDEDEDRLGLRQPGTYAAHFALPRFLLAAGRYSLSLVASVPRTEALDDRADALTFEIEEELQNVWFKSYARARGAKLIVPIKWSVRMVEGARGDAIEGGA